MNKQKYQRYINNFRRRLTRFLKPGMGLLCNIYPSDDGGAILEFIIGLNKANDDIYMKSNKSLGSALSNIEQRSFGGNLEGISFGGTNTILEENRIIYIKEANKNEWNDSAANNDVSFLVSHSSGGSK